MQNETRIEVRHHLCNLTILATTCALLNACSLVGPPKNTVNPREASASALCLAPVLEKAGDLASAVEPAVEATKQKISEGRTLTIVDVAPLIDLANFVLDVQACVQTVQAAQSGKE